MFSAAAAKTRLSVLMISGALVFPWSATQAVGTLKFAALLRRKVLPQAVARLAMQMKLSLSCDCEAEDNDTVIVANGSGWEGAGGMTIASQQIPGTYNSVQIVKNVGVKCKRPRRYAVHFNRG